MPGLRHQDLGGGGKVDGAGEGEEAGGDEHVQAAVGRAVVVQVLLPANIERRKCIHGSEFLSIYPSAIHLYMYISINP